MKYLYGDLTAFPAQENTLQLLRLMIDMAVELLTRHRLMSELRTTMQQRREWLADYLQQVDAFKQRVLDFIAKSVEREGQERLAKLAHACNNDINHTIKRAKAEVVAELEQQLQQLQDRQVEQRQQAFRALEAFFSPARLPLQTNRLKMFLDGQEYRGSVEIVDVTGICCSYEVAPGQVELFSQPRRFTDILPGRYEVPVGLKKAWLKRQPVAQQARLEEYLLLELSDDDERQTARLQKRGGGEWLLVTRLKRAGAQGIELHRGVQSEPAQPVDSHLLQPQHRQSLLLFMQQLEPSLLELYRGGGRLVAVSIDGRDVLEGNLATELVRRLVHFLAPTIREIDARSPSPLELSLKLEHDDGRREELYVSKQELADKLSRLERTQRALFTPLGIDPALAEPTDEEALDDGPTVPE